MELFRRGYDPPPLTPILHGTHEVHLIFGHKKGKNKTFQQH